LGKKLVGDLVLLLGLVIGVTSARADGPVPLSAQDVHPLGVGDSVPDGTLTTLDGGKIHLKALVSQKPTVLIFYRGGWCPYCNLQMGQLVKIEPDLEKMGYQVLAITPDQPKKLKESLDKHRINYTLLSDSPMEVTRKFKLAYRVSPEILAKMKGFGVDLEGATGNHLHMLPVPAAYVVDQKGLIHFVYYNPDIKVRVNPDDLLKAAKEAKS
jgi:peroxiredoxin